MKNLFLTKTICVVSMTRQKSRSFTSFARTTNTQPWMPALCDVTEGTNTWQNSPGRCPPPSYFSRLPKTCTVQRNISVWRQAVNTGLNMMLFLRFLELQFPVGIKSKVARISTTGSNFKVNKGKKKRKTRAHTTN